MKTFWQRHFNCVKETIYPMVERLKKDAQPRWMKGMTAVFATHMIVSITLKSVFLLAKKGKKHLQKVYFYVNLMPATSFYHIIP